MTDHSRRLRKAVLPVAGLGTRVLPGTKAPPKELLNVVDRPILSYIVEEAREAVEAINRDYREHCLAVRAVAAECFEAGAVVARLLAALGLA